MLLKGNLFDCKKLVLHGSRSACDWLNCNAFFHLSTERRKGDISKNVNNVKKLKKNYLKKNKKNKKKK